MTAPVFVRCRDGAFYVDPTWLLGCGYVRGLERVTVDGRERQRCELVVWLPQGSTDSTPPPAGCFDELVEAFGYGNPAETMLAPNGRYLRRSSAFVDSMGYRGREPRPLPGSEPVEFRPAIFYAFELLSRPPRPTLHEGAERYARGKGIVVLDMPASSSDARALDLQS